MGSHERQTEAEQSQNARLRCGVVLQMIETDGITSHAARHDVGNIAARPDVTIIVSNWLTMS